MKFQININAVFAFIAASILGVVAVIAVGVAIDAFTSINSSSKQQLPMTSLEFTPPQVDEDNPDAFDPEGIYEASENDLIKGFEIKNKNLQYDCDDARFGTLTDPKLFVTDKNEIVYRASVLTIENAELSFVTETLNETKYVFNGDFLVKGNFYTLDPDKKVVKGKLIKFVDGKKVSEADTSFIWSIDLDCVC